MKAALVKRAAAEYFIEGFMHAEVARAIESTPESHRVDALESMRPPRSVPDGCFVWIGHLVWLEKILELTPVPLTAAEAEGLSILKRERARFMAAHPPCPHCGLPNEPHAFTCRECMGEIKR